jgi:hypothetical protein
VVDGDPLTRIEDAATVSKVIKHGAVHTIADLVAPFAGSFAQAALDDRRRFACEASPEYWWHDPAFLAHARASCCDGACGFAPGMSLQV